MHNPSITANGDIYFTAPVPRPGQDPTWRLYRAAYRNGRYERARALTFSNGKPADAEEPCVAPDQSYLIFASRGIRLPIGHKHFFIALREGTSWGPVTQIRFVGDDSPSANNDAEPELGPDGATLYFNATRSIPVAPKRTRAWDNGNSHVWMLPLRPLLDTLRQRT